MFLDLNVLLLHVSRLNPTSTSNAYPRCRILRCCPHANYNDVAGSCALAAARRGWSIVPVWGRTCLEHGIVAGNSKRAAETGRRSRSGHHWPCSARGQGTGSCTRWCFSESYSMGRVLGFDRVGASCGRLGDAPGTADGRPLPGRKPRDGGACLPDGRPTARFPLRRQA